MIEGERERKRERERERGREREGEGRVRKRERGKGREIYLHHQALELAVLLVHCEEHRVYQNSSSKCWQHAIWISCQM